MRWPALLLLALLAACHRGPGAALYLARAQALQQQADRALAGGHPDGAREALLEAARLPSPADMPALEVRALRQDAYGRLSALEFARGRTQEAWNQAQAGLELGAGQDVFAVQLRVARGRAAEALGRDAEAVADYHQALEIDQALLAAEQADGGRP